MIDLNKIKYLLLIFPIFSFAYSETFVYDKDIDGNHTQTTITIDERDNQYFIEGKHAHSTTMMEYTLHYTIEKIHSKTSKDNEYLFYQDGNYIKLKKIYNGHFAEREYALRDSAWIQDFDFGLKPFLMSSLRKYKFSIINPKNLTMTKMIAIKQEVEPVVVNSKEYLAQKVKITLQGYKKMFWSTEVWYDTKSDTLLIYKANEGPSTPTMIKSLLYKH